jgi:hypothetical protein
MANLGPPGVHAGVGYKSRPLPEGRQQESYFQTAGLCGSAYGTTAPTS